MTMMTSKSLAAGVIAIAGWMIAGLPARAQQAPFAGLSGSWTGSGSIALSDGSHERLRCRATYRVDGSGTKLQQTLRCASDSYKVELSSDVVSDGAQLRWVCACRFVAACACPFALCTLSEERAKDCEYVHMSPQRDRFRARCDRSSLLGITKGQPIPRAR